MIIKLLKIFNKILNKIMNNNWKRIFLKIKKINKILNKFILINNIQIMD